MGIHRFILVVEGRSFRLMGGPGKAGLLVLPFIKAPAMVKRCFADCFLNLYASQGSASEKRWLGAGNILSMPNTKVETTSAIVETIKPRVDATNTMTRGTDPIAEEANTFGRRTTALVKEPNIMFSEPRTMVEALKTLIQEPNARVRGLNTRVEEPKTLVEATNILVEAAHNIVREANTMVKIDQCRMLIFINNLIKVSDHGV